ncbi:hypothetical protein psyc5s11_24790 [Clostridium gelidum]|uniref:Uncharacterized protein n=1 Tax=Clostridium gelidum TaxID=704125 RepID=A0ABM7T442_9CLOT|nr:hypothetical protein [Clostridium gelidum]BCZ46412.1 hypothetical protein psyc5s11_24790 [Clostridium gelidum]
MGCRRHKALEEYKKKIMMLPQDVIEVIGTEIFEINSIDELKKYF